MQDLDVDFDVEICWCHCFHLSVSDHWSLIIGIGLLDLFRPNGYRYLKFNSFSILVQYFFKVLWYGTNWSLTGPALALPILQALPRGILQYLHKKLSCMTYTTAFSGVDAPGAALHTALADLRLRLGYSDACSHLNKPHHAMAVGWSKQARQEMEHGPACPDILVKDISALWKPESRQSKFRCCCGVGFSF